MNLQGHTAIISGGLGDIGRAIARELHGLGAAVALCDIRPANVANAFLAELGSGSRYDRVDVSDEKAVAQWLRVVEKAMGLPSLVIPNAAIVNMATLRGLNAAKWKKELSVNLDGAFYVANGAAQRLVQKTTPGRIVFIGSWAADVAHAHIPSYCVAKAGLRMLMKQMALEYAADDILVNEVAPGYVDAGLSKQIFAEEPAMKKRATRDVPVRRLIAPADVAMQVAHLCDPGNRHMTGSVLLMDGGLSLIK